MQCFTIAQGPSCNLQSISLLHMLGEVYLQTCSLLAANFDMPIDVNALKDLQRILLTKVDKFFLSGQEHAHRL